DGTSFDALNAHEHRFAVSPDGRRIVFVATSADGKNRLWIRGLDAVAPRMLEGTEDPVAPFWSPDSRWVAFFADKKLKKIDTTGGAPQSICNAPNADGTWSRDGVILFFPHQTRSRLYRV